jgi:transposase
MSENETITHEELEKQVEEAYKEREKLFKPPEQMIIASKVKIVDEEARKLFPELARDLEVNGLINDVCIDEDGFPHDGLKRIRLLGLEQIKALGKLKIVPRDSKCENIPLTKKARIQHLKWSYEYFLQNAKLSQNATIYGKKIADILAERYGIHRATVYRWIKNNFTESTQVRKPKEQKPKGKCNVCDYPRQVQNLEEQLARIREQYNKAISNIEEVVASDEFKLSRAISIFLQRHPNREFTSDGKIVEKIS